MTRKRLLGWSCLGALAAAAAAVCPGVRRASADEVAGKLSAIWTYEDGLFETAAERPIGDEAGACGDTRLENRYASGRILEFADGTFFLEGFGCRLAPKPDSSTPAHRCERGAQEELQLPEAYVQRFTLEGGEVVLEGEMTKADFRFCFALRAPVERRPGHQ